MDYSILAKRADENEEQYIWRLGQLKETGELDLDWNELTEIINKNCRNDESEYRQESAYRKPYQAAYRYYSKGVFSRFSEDDYIKQLTEAKQEIQKERAKISDERVSYRRELREQGRRESMFEIVKKAIQEFKPSRFDYQPHLSTSSDNDLIIHLTDIHCGVDIISPFNTFNTEVLKDRLHKYLNEISEIQKTYNSENAYLLLGGDLLSGIIHTNSRIEAKENVVMQIMTVTDLISNFVYELSKIFNQVEVHTTAGNHSRAMANKSEAIRGENFDLLIPFTCSKDLKDIKNVKFVDNQLESDIATFTVRGHMVYATHGDKDTTKNVVYHMTNFARKAKLPLPDICFLGHRHTNSMETIDDVKVIQSGCVDGMDGYAIDSRLVGSPEQTVTVVTEKHRVKALCDIQLD
jgi:predicted phosphodiesterase